MPLDIMEDISASSVQIVRGVLWFQAEIHYTWNLEQYKLQNQEYQIFMLEWVLEVKAMMGHPYCSTKEK